MAATTKVSHPSVDERRARGKEARDRTPPSSHAGWMPSGDRPDPVGLLEAQNVTREPDLVPVRHGRMLVSPFTFYRGAATIMAADLDGTPTAGLQVQLCGDAHLSNFGAFASPERRLLFDLNDFDETLPGPFEYDVKRMAASFTVAARNNDFSNKDARAATQVGTVASAATASKQRDCRYENPPPSPCSRYAVCLRRLPLPARRDRRGCSLVPALRPVLPRRRGTAG
jgi:hypothetical protein